MSNHPEQWEVYLSKEEFENLRSDSNFVALLPLARVVNSLKFCSQILIGHSNSDLPSDLRQHMNSFLFSCGILYEGLKVANTLGKHFGERNSFKDGFGQLLKSKETKKLNDTVLNSMRNRLVFHFDEDIVPAVLKNVDFESYTFATGDGSKSGEVYYKLADEIAINFIIGEPGSKEEELRKLRDIYQSISTVITEYVKSADVLISDVLKDMNWAICERKKSSL